MKRSLFLLACLLWVAGCRGAILVAPGHEAVLVSEDDSPFEGDGVKGGSGGNAYFESTSYMDPCDDYKGKKYPYTTLPEYGSDLLGFYVVSDCQVVLCTKYRSTSTATACGGGDCVSQSSSSSGGTTKIYDLVQKDGANAEFPGAQTGDVCKCLSFDTGYKFYMADGYDTCYISQKVVSLYGGYYSNCLRDNLESLGKPAEGAGCESSASSTGGKVVAVFAALFLIAVQ